MYLSHFSSLQISSVLTVLSAVAIAISISRLRLKGILDKEYRKLHGRYDTPLARLGGTPHAPYLNDLRRAVMYKIALYNGRLRCSYLLWLGLAVFPLASLSLFSELAFYSEAIGRLMMLVAVVEFLLIPLLLLLIVIGDLSRLASQTRDEHPIAQAERLATEDALSGDGTEIAKEMFPEIAFVLR